MKSMMSGRLQARSGATLRGAILTLAATVVAVFALQSPSMAEDNFHGDCPTASVSCQNGVKVAGPQGVCATAGSSYASTVVCVDYNGDYVYVKDNDADGKAGIGSVWTPEGSVHFRLCRNPHGNGTWAKCNFNWAESGRHGAEGGFKQSNGILHLQGLWEWYDK